MIVTGGDPHGVHSAGASKRCEPGILRAEKAPGEPISVRQAARQRRYPDFTADLSVSDEQFQ